MKTCGLRLVLKADLAKHLVRTDLTDLVTVIATRHLTWQQCQFHLWKVARRVHEKVCRQQRFGGRRTDELLHFVALFERSKADVPHYHLPLFAHPAVRQQLLEAFSEAWSTRFPARGAFDSRAIGSGSNQQAALYSLKRLAFSEEAVDAHTTSWHLLPPLCRSSGQSPGDVDKTLHARANEASFQGPSFPQHAPSMSCAAKAAEQHPLQKRMSNQPPLSVKRLDRPLAPRHD
jgi:hypothetical protein